MSRRLAFLLAPALYLGLASCATNPVTGGQDFVLVTEAQELRLGRQVDAQVKQRYGLYLRPMNGLYPKGEPAPGQTLKIVQ